MKNYKLVLPGHLNHYGQLFGGILLQWVDETAWLAATLEYPGCNFVTIGMDKVVFKKGVRQGAVLTFRTERYKTGRTSAQYAVEVHSHYSHSTQQELVFTTHITFVRIDEKGDKLALPEPQATL